MSSHSMSPRPPPNALDLLRTGLCIGLAGGLAEIVIVWAYSTLSGEDAAIVARQVAGAIGLVGGSAVAGMAIHLGLAATLGIGLVVAIQTMVGHQASGRFLYTFMVGSLTLIWAINFFVVLPVISPSFVHLLPYTITLASKLMFALVAAATFQALSRRAGIGLGRGSDSPVEAVAASAGFAHR